MHELSPLLSVFLTIDWHHAQTYSTMYVSSYALHPDILRWRHMIAMCLKSKVTGLFAQQLTQLDNKVEIKALYYWSFEGNIQVHDDVIKWKKFPRYWPFVRGIHRSPVNSPHKGQWRGALMFTLICARINGWVNNGEAGDLKRYRTHNDVIVMWSAGYPHKWPIMRKVFPCHDVVMNTLYIEFSLCKFETGNVIITQNISCDFYQNSFDVTVLMIYLPKDTRLQTGPTASTHLLCRHL